MTLEELTRQITRLPERDFLKFSEWFDVYREAATLTDAPATIRGAHEEELHLRKAEYLADRSSARAWDDGFFDRLRQHLADARAPKAQTR